MATRTQSRQRSGESSRTNRPGNDTANTPEVNESDLAAMKMDELRQVARERGLQGTSGLRKNELVKAVAKALSGGSSTGSRTAKKQAGGEAKKQAGGDARKQASAAAKPRTDQKKQVSGGARRGSGSSKTLKYAQEIESPDEQPERPGRTLVTTDHDVIRQWAEERDAVPATIEGSEHEGRAGVLRFDFPGGDSGGRLVQISWDEWFDTFDQRQLNFIYQEERTDGRQSNFFRLENPGREDA